MKRFKEWWKDKWQYTSFRYGVIIVALLILCVVVSIYADIRDRGRLRLWAVLMLRQWPSRNKMIKMVDIYRHNTDNPIVVNRH